MLEIRHDSMNETAETQSAYDEFYVDGGVDLPDSYYYWLLDVLNPLPGKLLFDVSCGRGKLVNMALDRGINAYGLDFSYRAITQNPINPSKGRYLVTDGERSGLTAGFADYITHIGNLEHYQNPAAGIREVARLLAPTGVAFILLPNLFSFFGNMQFARKTGHVFDDGQPLQRYNTRKGWQELLEANGLVVFKTIRYEHARPRTKKDWITHLKRPTRILRLFMQRFVPFNWSNSFVYFCRRAV